ncbi:MAG TPA: hypothetical protein VMK65_03685, partial [Longimicrobiales bacterium]|nr:hypothetical protein [Longimicrobiales bacterium]
FGDQPGSRGAGEIDLLRVAVSGLWRMRANVPGYFSFGAGALHYAPQRRVGSRSIDPDGEPTFEPLFRDEAEWMPAAHVGAGIDITSGDHAARFDVRVYGARSGQDVPRASGDTLTPRLAFDVQFYVGYLIRL